MTGNFRPFGNKHAINTVAFVVEFNVPLEPKVFQEISLLHANFKEDLPRKAEEQAVVVNLDPTSPGSPVRSASPEIGGIVFDRLAPDGRQEWALKVQPGLAQVLCSNYERWSSVWAKAENFFKVVLPVIHKHNRVISAVGLQYIDEFIWEGSKSELEPSALFQKDSIYLVPNSYEMNDLWHCHHGFFVDSSDPAPHKRLNNINIDISDSAENKRVVRISTTHRSILKQAIQTYVSVVDAEKTGNTIDAHMSAMHDENKSMLGKLLNNEMCKRIKLNP